jgi:AcrR family transcriptional regulator
MSDAATLEPIGKREKTKAANRQAILDAARAVFAQLGYEAATVRDIIRGTDLASGTFYNYFKSKEEVYEALADDGARRFRPILRMSRENAKSFQDYLHSAFVAYFQFILADNSGEGRPIDERRPHVLRMDRKCARAWKRRLRGAMHRMSTLIILLAPVSAWLKKWEARCCAVTRTM